MSLSRSPFSRQWTLVLAIWGAFVAAQLVAVVVGVHRARVAVELNVLDTSSYRAAGLVLARGFVGLVCLLASIPAARRSPRVPAVARAALAISGATAASAGIAALMNEPSIALMVSPNVGDALSALIAFVLGVYVIRAVRRDATLVRSAQGDSAKVKLTVLEERDGEFEGTLHERAAATFRSVEDPVVGNVRWLGEAERRRCGRLAVVAALLASGTGVATCAMGLLKDERFVPARAGVEHFMLAGRRVIVSRNGKLEASMPNGGRGWLDPPHAAALDCSPGFCALDGTEWLDATGKPEGWPSLREVRQLAVVPEPDDWESNLPPSGIRSRCALLVGGAVRCWIRNGPTRTPLAGEHVAQLVADGKEVYAVLVDGRMTALNLTKRARLLPPLADVVELGLAAERGCARTRTGDVRCWRDEGETKVPEPETVRIRNAEQIAVGDHHACARANGHVYCWGQLTPTHASSGPTELLALAGAEHLAVANAMTCAKIRSDVVCVGVSGHYIDE